MTTTASAPHTARVNKSDAVLDALCAMLPSALPALVFTSLAAVSVPLFSDSCHIFVEEDGLGAYRIGRPLAGIPDLDEHPDRRRWARDSWSGQWVGDHRVQTNFDETHTGLTIGYRGSVLHLWHSNYHPTGTDIALAQLAVDHAVACLHREQEQARASVFPPTVGLR